MNGTTATHTQKKIEKKALHTNRTRYKPERKAINDKHMMYAHNFWSSQNIPTKTIKPFAAESSIKLCVCV